MVCLCCPDENLPLIRELACAKASLPFAPVVSASLCLVRLFFYFYSLVALSVGMVRRCVNCKDLQLAFLRLIVRIACVFLYALILCDILLDVAKPRSRNSHFCFRT